MLPQRRWFFLSVIVGLWLSAIAILGGCHQRGTPEAQVRVTVGTLGRELADSTAFELAADMEEAVLKLKLEDDEWKVVRAAWSSTRRG